jgi:hypothetical protein
MTTIILEDSVGATASVEGTAEAIVSSPIHHDKDVDPTVAHAPRRAREQTQQVSTLPAAPQIELPAMQLALKTLYDGISREDILAQPDALPEPPQLVSNDRPVGRIALLICSVVGVAAGVAWAITWMPDARATLVNLGVRWASVATRPEQPNRQVDVAAKAMPEPKSTQEPASSPDRSEPASFNSAAATMTQPPPAQVPVPAPVVATREPTPQQTVPDFVTRHLDADELASMLRRADDLINTGDLSSARLLLRRVAEAGDARAAFTLAGTFDPNVFKALGLQDGALDIALARLWYERAAQLGSADAPRRLQQLAIASAQ